MAHLSQSEYDRTVIARPKVERLERSSALRFAEERRNVEADRLRRTVGAENVDRIELSAVHLRQILRDDAGARLLREDPPPLCANTLGLVTCTGDNDRPTAARSIASREANVRLRRRKHGRSRHGIGARHVRHYRGDHRGRQDLRSTSEPHDTKTRAFTRGLITSGHERARSRGLHVPLGPRGSIVARIPSPPNSEMQETSQVCISGGVLVARLGLVPLKIATKAA
jgi:hypothetical protein